MARIVHLCVSNFYIDGTLYQENQLVGQHVRDGNDVLVIASTEVHSASGDIAYTSPGEYLGKDGARVIRLPYRKWLPAPLARKLRMHPNIYPILVEFKPDAILFHGCAGWELRTVARYVRRHPGPPFYVDSHADWTHSARNLLSRELLHKLYYRHILLSVLPQVKKILCVSTEVMQFAREIYGVPEERLEFFPLGGWPVPDGEYRERRTRTRDALGVGEDQILVVQSGKQTRRKKLIETLRAFAQAEGEKLRLVIAGVIKDDIRQEAERLIAQDPRVTYAGWKDPDELTDLLCAADVYVQPGTQSATMQHSLCCRCAIVLDDVAAHRPYLRDNGWLLGGTHDLVSVFAGLERADLSAMARNSYAFACESLDYRILSRRILG